MDEEKAFKVLELGRNTSMENAKRIYLAKVKFFHPDRFASNEALKFRGEEKLKEINVAYEIIKLVLKKESLKRKEKTADVEKPAGDDKAKFERPAEKKRPYRQNSVSRGSSISSGKEKTTEKKGGIGFLNLIKKFIQEILDVLFSPRKREVGTSRKKKEGKY